MMQRAKFEQFLLRSARARLSRHREEVDGEFIQLNKAVVRARVANSAGRETVVIVPDPPNLIEHHAPVIDRLAQDFRVVCFELPGFGFSHPSRGFGFTLEEQVALVIELLERLGVKAATLEIACLGAFVGMQVAARRPDLIRRLLLLQVPSFSQAQQWSRRADVVGVIRTPWLGQLFMHAGKSLVARHWYEAALPPMHEDACYHRYLDPTLAAFRRGACCCLASAYQALQAQQGFEVSGLRQDTTVIWGTADGTHAATDPRSILREIPHARLLEFEDCGHFPSLEATERYLSLLYAEDIEIYGAA